MDKASIRRLQLIDILSSEDKWFITEELAKYLDFTQKTIRTDIQFLNPILPDGWEITSSKGIDISKLKKAFGHKIVSVGFAKREITFQNLKELNIDFLIADYHLK